MNFISICSGIEAASVAFGPLGWKAIAFSEIDKFACAVLAHHYPAVRNYGDMSLFREWPEEVFAFADAVVGGPPCQAFSVAGARRGLADARGNLTLIYVELLNHADAIRKKYGKPPVVALYENVPGIFSDKTNAFGCLVGGLAGEDVPAIPPGKRWTDAGCVFGPERAVAWRLFDAQFFALAQRRRRVFVVASARPGFDPAQVLFEWDSVRRDSAPSRQAREVAPTIPSRSLGGGGLGTDFDCDGGLIAGTLQAGGKSAGSATQQDAESGLLVKHSLRGEGFDASEDGACEDTTTTDSYQGEVEVSIGNGAALRVYSEMLKAAPQTPMVGQPAGDDLQLLLDIARSDGYHTAMGEVAARAQAVAGQPAEPSPAESVWLFKHEGKWHHFVDEGHRQRTIEDGRWDVREFVAAPKGDSNG